MISLIPMPAKVEERDGSFTLSSVTVIAADGAARSILDYVPACLLAATGFRLNVVGTEALSGERSRIVLRIVRGMFKNPEAYHLDVTPQEVTITASSPTGAFYAVQTLRQMLPPEIYSSTPVPGMAWIIPCMHIEDVPRFSWRGIMLDCSRYFYPVDFIKRFIDLMAVHKLNVFHWHLTDDQGWRIEIKKHPKLSDLSAWRKESLVGHYDATPRQFDGVRHGGIYTQADVRDVVAYASERHVAVMPEIEMPGHAQAALAARPELSCTGKPLDVSTLWGVHKEVFCAGNDAVFTFLADVLNEVVPLFPSPYFHIGGDECPKDRWKACPKCQARIKAEGLKGEQELQSWFVRRMDKFLEARGKRLIGWDEIAEGGLAANVTVMCWHGVESGIEAAQKGHDVVMSPTSHCYLDYYQSEQKDIEPLAIGGCITLDKAYAFEPVPEHLPPAKAKHILGAQGNVWTEYMPTPAQVEFMTFPRACALAEVAWSPKEARAFDAFKSRMVVHVSRLDALRINARKLD